MATVAQTERKALADKAVADGAERQAKAVKEHDERLAGARPTPTQDEIDAARNGLHSMVKEDDGSGPERVGVQRTMAAGSGAPYKTRDASPARASVLHAAHATPSPAPSPTFVKSDEKKSDDKK